MLSETKAIFFLFYFISLEAFSCMCTEGDTLAKSGSKESSHRGAKWFLIYSVGIDPLQSVNQLINFTCLSFLCFCEQN